jgi:hypothetical protein
VFGPGFGAGPFPDVLRLGNEMLLAPPTHSPAGGWAGYASDATARIVVERNGKVIADEPQSSVYLPAVPPEEGAYRLSVDVNRGAPSTLSTKVSATWTFRSGHVPGTKPVPLPLSAVRFAPALNEVNTAPAGTAYGVPFEVQRQPGSTAGVVKTLNVEVSYDDGATWRKPVVIRVGRYGIAIVRHPAGAGFVSLRARSTDTAGNTVEQTVIRAYRIA